MNTIKYNKEDVQHVFDTNPQIDHVIVTEDDHIFIPKNIGFCKSHCDLKAIKFEKVFKEGIEQVEELESNESEKSLEEMSFAELKQRCIKIDLRMIPKSKKEAIEMIKATLPETVEEDEDETTTNENTSPDNTEE